MGGGRTHTDGLIRKLKEDERNHLLQKPKEELVELILELYEQIDILEQGVRKHELSAVYQKDRADRATHQFKTLSESGEHERLKAATDQEN
jgi:hypothetical protein